MKTFPAQPGWFVVVWVREEDGAVKLPIVAWAYDERPRELKLEPVCLGYEQQAVELFNIYDDDEYPSQLFVRIMKPGDELADFIEEAEMIGRIQKDAENRTERENEPDPGPIPLEVEG